MKSKRTLATLALIGVLGITGCGDVYKEGTIEKISVEGVSTQVVESKGAVFGNESIKFSHPRYLLEIRTNEGTYVASLETDPYENKTAEGLVSALKQGSRVKFLVDGSSPRSQCFGKDKVGRLYADQIEILGR